MTLPVITASDGNYPAYNFPSNITVLEQLSETSLQIEAPLNAFKYNVTVQKLASNGSNSGSAIVSTSVTNPITITGLEKGGTYNFSIQATNSAGTNRGNTQTIKSYTLTYSSFSGTVVSSPLNPEEIESSKSYLEITYSGNNKNEFALAYKTFAGIEVPTYSNVSYNFIPEALRYKTNSYTDSYYTFGTSIFMGANDKYPNQCGGVGFFLNEAGNRGYLVLVETTAASASRDRKTVRIQKLTPDGAVTLYDSQKSTETTFDGVYGGKAYVIDVKVRVYQETVTINAYINGFKITAIDQNDFSNINNLKWINQPTNKVGLISLKGTTLFDYVYGTSIDKARYNSSEYNPNLYQGQFSNDTLDIAYGNILYNSNYAEDEINKTKNIVEEFGSVIREIVHVKQKFDSRPTFPIKWSTGLNKYAKIIGQSISSFGGEAYVLNNTSTTIPLSDGAGASFYVLGNDLGQSGTLEYSTDETEDYNSKEPIIFESRWLQNEDDVKKLANWIKDKVVNRGKLIEMNTFGNPLLSVGDIVSIKYIYQGLAGTEKFIITNISHRYNEGLETSVTCRTL